jgi:hypothetical protein
LKFNIFNKKKIKEVFEENQPIKRELLQHACSHPLWVEFSQETIDDDVYKEVKCVVCELEKDSLIEEFTFYLNGQTGRYETNIININDLNFPEGLDNDQKFKIIQAEFEKFARNYEQQHNHEKSETVKQFKKNYRK